MDDLQYLNEAVALAKQSVEMGGGPFGALIVQDDQVIGRGCNCVTGENDPTAHAEIVAIRAACHTIDNFSLAGATIYASCEPCPMCLAAAYWARVERIVFAASSEQIAAAGFDDVVIEQELRLPAEQRSIPTEQIALDSVDELFTLWKQKADKILY